MKTLKGIILIVCYVTSMSLALFTIYHYDTIMGSLALRLAVAMVLAFTGIGISVAEVIKSSKLGHSEKVIWIVLILFLYTIGELLYIILRRRRVL